MTLLQKVRWALAALVTGLLFAAVAPISASANVTVTGMCAARGDGSARWCPAPSQALSRDGRRGGSRRGACLHYPTRWCGNGWFMQTSRSRVRGRLSL
jgi:hypothetical protein